MFFDSPETIIRLRRKPVSHPYGGDDDLADWSDPDGVERTEIAGCAIGPSVSDWRVSVGREQATMGMSLYGPIDVDILPGDRIQTADGIIYEANGHPLRYQSPFGGWEPGSVTPIEYYGG